MEIALFLVALAVVVIAGTALAGRIGIPAPLVLIVVGVAGSLVPHVPEVHLEPDIVLLGLLPPLLYSAALQTSLVEFAANKRPILLLSVGLVLFTAFGVGAVVHLIVPSLGWPLAIAIGAVVAPPDAVAATAIAKRVGLPRQVVTILEGESLLNDATALVALRTAIGAASVAVHAGEVGLDFLWASIGGAALGVLVFLLVAAVRRRLDDTQMDTAISLVTPFAAYLLAEELHSSGVIAVVVAGLLLGHKAPVLQSARSRLTETTIWRTVAFLLENTVFLLIGMQAVWIVEGVAASSLSTTRIALVCAAALVSTIALRMVWLLASRLLLVRRGRGAEGAAPPPLRNTVMIGWAGMRGVLTLAAAFIIPEDAPHREVLLLIAFTVVAGTLFIQGLTIPWLARRLAVPSPDPLEDALVRASLLQQASKAGMAELETLTDDDPHGVSDQIKKRVEQRNFAAWERLSTTADEESPSQAYTRIRLATINAEREKVLEVRSAGNVASEVVREVLAMLDVEESMLDRADEDREDLEEARTRTASIGTECHHLDEQPATESASREDALVCSRCVEVGDRWVALRRCLECGQVGCCDSSVNRHATEHFHDTMHPVMQSAQPGEDWRWCYVHHVTG